MSTGPQRRLRRAAELFACAARDGLIQVLLLISFLTVWPGPVWAQALDPTSQGPSSSTEVEWGGYVRAIGTVTFPDPQSIDQFSSTHRGAKG